MAKAAEMIRFGSTSRALVPQPDPSCKDIRICEGGYIVLHVETTIKKTTEIRAIWLCALSILDMYDLVKVGDNLCELVNSVGYNDF